MPIYTYTCKSCDHQFDKLVRKMEGKSEVCPECGQDAERGIELPGRFVWGRRGGWS